MRISDWSSDVCSSDLRDRRRGGVEDRGAGDDRAADREIDRAGDFGGKGACVDVGALDVARRCKLHPAVQPRARKIERARERPRRGLRSEEHTSELQSLMRISYAVFCLKKKKKKMPTNNTSI